MHACRSTLEDPTLPLGLAAPFGVTILGWVAIGDIRRSRGGITGLPLAVIDGLLFPLLAVNALLASVWMYSVRALAQGLGNHGFTGPWPTIGSLGALLICAIATIDISRRVWRAVRRAVNTHPRHMSTRGRIAVGVAGALAIVVGILLIEFVYTEQSKTRPGGIPSSFQVAEIDPVTGALVARLPRGEVSLLAVSDEKAAPNQWWRPDGTPVTNALFEVNGVPEASGNAQLVRDFVFQVRDLPSGASGPEFKVLPSGGAGSGGEVRMNGEHLRHARPARIYFQQSVEQATVRLGFGLEEWRTIVVHDPGRHSVKSETRPGDPRWSVHFHNVNDSPDGVQATFLAARFKHEWSMRLVAVDTNGVEHTFSRASGTPSEENATWTYTFRKLTLAATKELRVQVRPLHWVEFRDVALEPKDRSALGKGTLPFKPTRFSEVREVRITGPFDFDTGKLVATTDVMRAMSQGSFLKSPLAREMGVDAAAGSSELRLVEMAIADLAPSEWERQRPETLSERLNRSQYGPPRLPSGRGIPLPLAYAFRTREGTLGMMQLLGVAEGEVFLRYKFVEPARFE